MWRRDLVYKRRFSMQRYSEFGPTKCGLILGEKIKILTPLSRRKVRRIYNKWMYYRDNLRDTINPNWRKHIYNLLLTQLKLTIYSDLYLHPLKDTDYGKRDDICDRLYYCIKRELLEVMK